LSAGGWIIVGLAVLSSIAVMTIKPPPRKDLEMWAFARTHVQMYEPLLAKWNTENPRTLELHLLSNDVLTRRMQSGFLSNTPIADLLEIERSMIGPVFSGPLEDVGFVDLTDRLKSEGLLEQINAPSFSPWTSRGRIFGLPHDVHPTLLAYRADIIEAEGIDVSKIETWDEFTRILRPLVKDLNGDGLPDRYVLSLWYTSQDQIEALLLQAGGGFFNEKNELILNSDTNAEVIAQVIAWTSGPDRIAADAPEFSASGNQLKLQGFVLAAVMPDWLASTWKSDLPQLGGKVKLMPLPAWKKGGRRTSVWGGTMLGIPKSSKNFDDAWKFAKHLYLSPDLAKQLWKSVNIVSPNKNNWNQPYYYEPDPYFANQVTGKLFIEQAPNVPLRPSSPYHNLAKARMMDAVVAVRQFAVANQQYDPATLRAEAKRQLTLSEAQVRKQIERNVFLREAP
jgi:arabinosaccharide transport system substrate-binding protein